MWAASRVSLLVKDAIWKAAETDDRWPQALDLISENHKLLEQWIKEKNRKKKCE